MSRWKTDKSYFEDGDDIWWTNERGDLRKISKKEIYRRGVDEDLEFFLEGDQKKEEKNWRITIDDLNVDDPKQRKELLLEYTYQLEKDIYEDLEAQFDYDYKNNLKQMSAEITHLKEINEKKKFEVSRLESENDRLKNKNRVFYETALKRVAQLKAFIKAAAAFNISYRKLEEEVKKQTLLQKNILLCLSIFGIESDEFPMLDQEEKESNSEVNLFSLDTLEFEEQETSDFDVLDIDDL